MFKRYISLIYNVIYQDKLFEHLFDISIIAPDDHGDGNNAVTSGIEKMTTSVP